MEFSKLYSSIDAHTAGEAYRIVTRSPIRPAGKDLKTKAAALAEAYRTEKNLLLNEPRGHRGMHGCIITESLEANAGLLFFVHDRVSAFKYEGVMAALAALLETGNLARTENDEYTVDTVMGIHRVKADMSGDEVMSVTAVSRSAEVSGEPERPSVCIDGERNYLIYPLPADIPAIELEHLAALSDWGASKSRELTDEGVSFSGVIVAEKLGDGRVRTVTFEPDGYILRSPGFDTTLALLAEQAKRTDARKLENESIFGSSLTAELTDEASLAGKVTAEPFVTGTHDFVFDREDPLEQGFVIA
ncbi:proline racemase family protein [Bhargavaea ullalensis]|uniref:Proline racemase n=1 Tax=Bhargavaea ullalensis TaxID=1265685 RepID=A0ABV2GA40_9BACL